MFEFFRTHNRWMQFILMILIVPSFALVGIQGYESFMHREPKLAEVGGQAILRSEFDTAHRNQIEQLQASMGSQFDPAMVDTPASRRQLLEDLIDRHLLALVATKARLGVSDGMLRDTIAAIPQVQDNGRFSPERYRQVLAAQGLTPAGFEANLRGQLSVGLVLDPVSSSAQVPSSVADSIAAMLTQQRVVALRDFKSADYRAKVQVSQQDIQNWYDANKQQLEVSEQVSAQYLVLDEAAATQGVQVKDSDIQSYYKQNIARFSQPERRRISHILISVPANATEDQRKAARARAEELAAQAQANPDGFADLAKKFSQDAGSAQQGGDLGWNVPPGLEKAVSTLSKGQVSGVVESPAGFHIIKVTDFQPGLVKPLAAVREQIVGEISKQMAATRFSDMATQLTKLVYDQRDSLQPAADALGIRLRTAAGITRSGLLPATQAGADAAAASPDAVLLDNPRVRQALFSPEVLRDKNNSGVIELSADTMLAVRVLKMTPAHIPALADVQDVIRDRLITERAAAAARQAGQAALKALQAPAPDAGASTGFGNALTVSRQASQGLPRPVLEAVMRMAPEQNGKPVYAGVSVGSDYTLVRLDSVQAGKVSDADRAGLTAQLSSAWGQAQDRAVLQLLRQQYGVKILPDAQKAIKGDNPTDGS
ncbi:SurA N-terminal domain-containing protein [Bordetella sp. FB-8]|uniref:SurA N-terminal domain-containing protein n=1 Tax=Bordetella sp. FB-8 TaxID=1159870 RepID=UPI00037DD2C1|nr:SurA N-terminal domain-containing protein [Bordetella sp. FB-8]